MGYNEPMPWVAAAALAALASPVHSAERYCWAGCESTVIIAPHPDAAAVVTFDNRMVHSTATAVFTLDLNGLSVSVEAHVGRGEEPDTIFVTPPAGYVAVPPMVTVQENDTGEILILKGEYLGG